MRAHFQTTVVDNQGNVLTGASVRLLNPGTTTLISQTIYGSADSGTPLANPFTSADGSVSVYCDSPLRVRFGVTVGANPEYFIEDVDLLLPPSSQALFVQNTAPSSPVSYTTIWVDTTGL
jgi:hypothetical protein